MGTIKAVSLDDGEDMFYGVDNITDDILVDRLIQLSKDYNFDVDIINSSVSLVYK